MPKPLVLVKISVHSYEFILFLTEDIQGISNQVTIPQSTAMGKNRSIGPLECARFKSGISFETLETCFSHTRRLLNSKEKRTSGHSTSLIFCHGFT